MAEILELVSIDSAHSTEAGNSLTNGTTVVYKQQNVGSSYYTGLIWHIPNTINSTDISGVRFKFYVNQFGGWSPTAGIKVIRENALPFGNAPDTPGTYYTDATSSTNIVYTTTWPASGWIDYVSLTLADVQAAMDDAGHDHATNGTDLAVSLAPDHDASGQQIQIRTETWTSGGATPPTLELTYTPEIVADGDSISSSIMRPNSKQVARWHGYDAPVNFNYGGYVSMMSAGLGDIPMTNVDGENPFGALWTAAQGNPAGPRVKFQNNALGEAGEQRSSIYFEDHLLGVYGPFGYWKPSQWFPEITNSLKTASLRFYYRPPVPTLGSSATVINFLLDGVYNWGVNMAGNYDTYSTGETAIVTGEGGTGWSTGKLSIGGFNRIELQISRDTDPAITMRVFRSDSDLTNPDLPADYVQTFNVTEAALEFDEIRIGSAASAGNLHYSYYADLEMWTDYDLNGAYQNPIVDTLGAPFVEPTYKWWTFDTPGESYLDADYNDAVFNDPGNFVELEDLGVIRSVDSDGTNVIFTTTAEDTPDWESSLSGPNGGAVDAGVNNSFTSDSGVDTHATYSDSFTALISEPSIDHSVAAGEISTFNYDLPAPMERAFIRFMINSSDYACVGGSAEMNILRAEDVNGDAIFTILVDYESGYSDWVAYIGDGDLAGNNRTEIARLSADSTYIIELLYDKNIVHADSLLARVYETTENAPTDSEGYRLETNKVDIEKIAFGPSITRDADFGGNDNAGAAMDITIAQHAVDSRDFMGFPSQNGLDVVAGIANAFTTVTATGSSTIATADGLNVPSENIAIEHAIVSAPAIATYSTGGETEYYSSHSVMVEAYPTQITTLLSFRDASANMARVTIDSSGMVGVHDGDTATAEVELGKMKLGEWYSLTGMINETKFEASLYNAAGYRLRAAGRVVPTTHNDVEHIDFGADLNAANTPSGSVFTADHKSGTSPLVVDWNSAVPDVAFQFTDVDAFLEKGQVAGGIVPNEYLDLQYNGSSVLRKLNLFTPPGTPPAAGWPIVVWMHGGSWTSGNRLDLPEALKQSCLAMGVAVASVGYQLAVETRAPTSIPSPVYNLNTVSGRFPTFILDFKEAAQWLALPAQESTYSIDGSRMIASGYSAGAFNALAAVITRDMGPDGSQYDLTLAGNTGSPYEYSNVADPVFKAGYGFAPPTNLGKLYNWEQGGPGETWPFLDGQQLVYYVMRSMTAYTQNADWQNQIMYISFEDWVGLNSANMVPVGAQNGSADYFVFSDIITQSYPEYGQYDEFRKALNTPGLPDGVNPEHLDGNPYHHDWVNDYMEFYQFTNFIKRYI